VVVRVRPGPAGAFFGGSCAIAAPVHTMAATEITHVILTFKPLLLLVQNIKDWRSDAGV
jgi:hypothetical protein